MRALVHLANTHRAALFSSELPRDLRLVGKTCAKVRRYLGVADG